ncbi:MAG: hypothetical protein ACYC1I_11260 [Acidimicrobiales bacterium]
MPRPHQTMRKIRDVLRLRFGEGLSLRQTALSLSMPLGELDDDALERLLFHVPVPSRVTHREPDFEVVQRELRQKGALPCNSSGSNTRSCTPRVTATASSVISTGAGAVVAPS